MKKLFDFTLFLMLMFFGLQQAAFSDSNVPDYTALNNAINTAPGNPSTSSIFITSDTLNIEGTLNAISNKSINFLSSAASGKSTFDGTGLYRIFTVKSGSYLTFSDIEFRNSKIAGSNGAFLGLNSSSAVFVNETSFTNGYAINGGAASVENYSYLHFTDNVLFDSNIAVDHGGGFYSRRSAAVFDGDAFFINNVSEYTGGGFHADTGSNIVFNGHVYLRDNSTIDNNGAGFYVYRSTITFKSAEFENNTSNDVGGGFYSSLSYISFTDTASFTGNFGRNSGGAFSAGYASVIDFYGKAFFNSNTSDAEGGAIDVSASAIVFNDDVEFDANTARSAGGGIYADENSYLQFEKSAIFAGNKANANGGAIAVCRSNASFNSNSTFENNSADYGGAFYINSGNISLSDTLFDGNIAHAVGGALYIKGSASQKGMLTVNTSSKTIFQNNKARGRSNALFLDSFSSAEFITASGASVEMYDGISGSGHDSTLIISGAGIFNFYDNISDIDIKLSGNAGSAFKLIGGANINAGKLTIGNFSRFDSVNNTADTIKVTGLDINGTLAMEISDFGTHDQIESSGIVNLGASSVLEITTNITDTNFRKKTYGLINSPTGINGVFGAVSVTTPTFAHTPAVNYGNIFKNWITLTVSGNNLVTGFTSSIPGLTFNQRQTAKTYDALSITSAGDMDAIISFIEGMAESGQKTALAQASGYFLANVIRSVSAGAENNKIYDRIKNHCLYGNSESGIWAQMESAAMTYSKDRNSLNDFNDGSDAIMMGFDRFIEENKVMLGFYGKHGSHDIKQGYSRADISNTGVGIYGGLIEDEWEIKALVSGTYDNYSTKRNIAFAGRKAKADFDGTTFAADIEGAYKYKFEENISLRPYIGFEAKNSHYNGFKEKDAESLNLKVSGDSYIRSAARIGTGAVYDNDIFDWHISAEIKYLFSGNSPEIESAFKGSDLIFKSRGCEEGKTIFGAVAGAAVRITRELKIFVNGSYHEADHFKNFYGNIGARWNFCDPYKEKKPKPQKVTKTDDYDPAKFLLMPMSNDPREMDAVITFEEAPLSSPQEEEYDAAIELLKSSQEKEEQPLMQEDEYDAALELLKSSQEKEEQPLTQEDDYDAALELLKASLEPEISMEDEKIVQQQQQEAALRRSKPVLKSFSLNMANFESGKSALTEKAKDNIRLQAAEIKKFDYEKITIEGHTDSIGSAAINKKLSRERAKAVFEIFVEEGIPAKKMSYIGFSALLPVASNDTEEGRAQNRRVEIFVE